MSMCRRVLAGVALLLTGIFPSVQAEEPVKLKTLVERLSSEKDEIREQAREVLDARSRGILESLGKFDPEELNAQAKYREEARPLAPALVKLLDSSDDECRASAAMLLAAMGPDAAVAHPKLLKIVLEGQDETPGVWIAAALALPHICPPDQAIGPHYLKSLAQIAALQTQELEKSRKTAARGKGDSDVDPVGYTAGFLGMIVGRTLIDSGRTQAELPTLIEMTKVKYPRLMRAAAISAMQILQREAAGAAPTLTALLQDSDPLVQRFSAGALLCATNDATIIPVVVARLKLSNNEKQDFRKSAQEFLDEQAQRRERTLESAYLQEGQIRDAMMMFANGNSVHRRYALQMLSELWPGTQKALTAVLPVNGKAIHVATSRAAESLDRLPQLRGGLVGLAQIPVMLSVELALVEVAVKDAPPKDRKLPIRSARRDVPSAPDSVQRR